MVRHQLSALDIAIGAQAVNRSSGTQILQGAPLFTDECLVAALTALVYDVLLSFNEEVCICFPYDGHALTAHNRSC